VKFLLDENLSPRLINRLDQLFPGLAHVGQFGLKSSDDLTILDWAKANAFSIITTDSDFVALAQRLGWPPKVIHLKQCVYPLRVIEELLRTNAVRIAEFAKDDRSGLLVLRFAKSGESVKFL
jgi:predicted nuclease of predicted toxin-antitoxin system